MRDLPGTNNQTPGNLTTPRDFDNNDQLSYRTPNTKHGNQQHLIQKEISQASLQTSQELGRREDAFSSQFYSNSQDHINDQQMDKSELQDDNIRICVDQWDKEDSANKRFDENSSYDPY